MLQIGQTSMLNVVERNREFITLQGQGLKPEFPSLAEGILLKAEEAPSAQVGDSLQVFIYTDSRGTPIASIAQPLVKRGGCAALKVVDVTDAGAFLDWGLEKNLLLPYAEQRRPVSTGKFETVLVYLDNSGRLAATSRLDHHLPETDEFFRPGQSANLLIFQRTDLGLKAIIDNRTLGLLYKDEIFQPVRVGETHQGYIKRIRPDGRIDLSLQPGNKQLQPLLEDRILDYLHTHEGKCSLCDKSSPEAIQAIFEVSKKNFKKALSTLYRERKIVIHTDHIVLPDTES